MATLHPFHAAVLLLLLLLRLHLVRPLPAQLLDIDRRNCPAWLHEYEQFHASNRSRPNAKYLVHRVIEENGGLGDRLRGMMFATRLAYATRRVVLFTWSQPYDVSAFLAPARGIDWRVDGTGYDAASSHPKYFWLYDSREGGPPWHEYLQPKTNRMRGMRSYVMRGGLNRVRDQWVTLSTNEVMHSHCYDCPELDPWGPDAMCLWHYLFKLLPAIEAAADEQLLSLFGGRQVPYAALHLRLGGFVGEPEAQERGRGGGAAGAGQLRDLIDGVRCAAARGAAAGVNVSAAAPLLMVTDSSLLRGFVGEGRLTAVVTSPLVPVHLERAAGLPKEAHYPTFIELRLLARARCLVLSQSGFSHQAFLYSRHVGDSCSVQLNDCFDHQSSPLQM